MTTRTDALRLGRAVGRVVAEVRNGAHSARAYSDDLLTYADGWSAAATAAAMAAAEVTAELLAPETVQARELIAGTDKLLDL